MALFPTNVEVLGGDCQTDGILILTASATGWTISQLATKLTDQIYCISLRDAVIDRLEFPNAPDLGWAEDANLTRKNLLALLLPVETKGIQWVQLAAGLRIQNEDNGSSDWIDTYDLCCCTSDKETIRNDGQARHLTIELEDSLEISINIAYVRKNVSVK